MIERDKETVIHYCKQDSPFKWTLCKNIYVKNGRNRDRKQIFICPRSFPYLYCRCPFVTRSTVSAQYSYNKLDQVLMPFSGSGTQINSPRLITTTAANINI